ncbi:hypothetical protein VB715_17030 [Crocosphaera sp. UHCC 0190]|uniref:hypothetical protein n=1 Tax=Crocosphaera sp. UHCC 0190 TaxID=3110246 RepID=UPI002B1FEB7C|nr:hypothetical protein [Crocosphaera sp. UHCC 0190]MEA5511479.1 hypothetical protein [Crocosphaera sp. UHCC 0190]
MKWIIYLGLTIIVYFLALIKLRGKVEREKVREAYIFWTTLLFFLVFEYVFINSIFTNFPLHLLGLFLSLVYALSIYFYLKSVKKDIDTIFYKLLQQSQGRISILTFMQATQLPSEEAQNYLNRKLKELRGNRHSTRGNIYYEFSIWQ